MVVTLGLDWVLTKVRVRVRGVVGMVRVWVRSWLRHDDYEVFIRLQI